MLVGEYDDVCTLSSAQRILNELGTNDKTLRTIFGTDHAYFAWATGDRFIQELIASIEGTDSSDFPMMTFDEIANSFIGGLQDKYGVKVVNTFIVLFSVLLLAICICSTCLCITFCACCMGCKACLHKQPGDGYNRNE